MSPLSYRRGARVCDTIRPRPSSNGESLTRTRSPGTSTKINSALDEEQRRAWRAITGSPYNFQPDFTRPITKD